jgi:hypothetical protein
MKKLSILLLLTLMAVGVGAVTVDVTVTKKGTLLDAVMQQTSDLESITELTVRGPLDEWDDMNVWADMTNLEVLNLQHAETDVFRNATMLTKLRRVALPDRVKRLDQMAFYGCTALSEVNIPSSLEQMGYYAFAMCQSLKEVSLPASFNRSEGYIFNGCSALKDVYCYSSDYEGSLFDDSNSGVTFHVHTILVDFFRGKENVQGLNVVGMDFNFSSLRLTSPVTIKDVSYYQGADITFDHGQYYDNSRYTSIYTMGALEIDAPASTKWQMGNITLPVSFYEYDTNYLDYDNSEDVFYIASLVNHRTPVEARQIDVKISDSQDLMWTFFSVPFDVAFNDIKGGKGKWVIRRYDPDNRAALKAGETWQDVKPGETLHAGEGYIFMRDYNTFYDDYSDDPDYYPEYSDDDFRIILTAAETSTKQNIFAAGDVVVPLKKTAAERSHNADWNLVGNPYPCYYDISAIKEKATIYVYDDTEDAYRTVVTGSGVSLYLAPCQTFFVQASDISQLTFQASGRRLKAEISNFGPDDDDEEWDNEDWDYYLKRNDMPEVLRQRMTAMKSRKKAAPQETFNPESPLDPGANYFNPLTGEAYFDLFTPGRLFDAVRILFGSLNFSLLNQVKKLTIVSPMTEGDFMMLFAEAETADLAHSSGFSTIPEGAFFYMTKLRTLILPECVTAIDDRAFGQPEFYMKSNIEQLDLYATTPPAVTAKVFDAINNKADLVVRVPSDAMATYRATPVWKDLNIQPLEGGAEQLQGVSIAVLTPDGTDLTSQCSIVWTDTDGTLLGTGSTLMAQPIGTTVNYSIGLSPAIANFYVPVMGGTYTVQPAGNAITINLVATGVADLGTKQLRGSKGTLDMTFVASDTEAPTLFNDNDALLTVADKASDAPFTDFVMQYPTVAFEQTLLQPGQTLLLTLTSRANLFQTAQAEATVGADGNFSAELTVKEWGQAAISCTTAEGATDIMALAFDQDGKYVARFGANGNIVKIRDLEDGTYRVVLTEQNQYLNAVTSLDALSQTVLRQGTDYTQLTVQLAAGTTNSYEATVPALDVNRIAHISNDSYIATNDPELTIGTSASMKAKAVFKEEYAARVSNIQLIVDIPEGMVFAGNSVISTSGTYQLSGQRLVIPCTQGEQVRWSLQANRSTDVSAATVPAMVQYILDGQQYMQPIGSANIDVAGLHLEMPKTTTVPQITVRGNAYENSHVTIYDGRAIVGSTTARSDGYFMADITLNPALDGTLHKLYADVETSGMPKFSTETQTVLYDKNANVLTNVDMHFQDQRIEWNTITGTLYPTYYNVNPNLSPTATFTAHFTAPKPQRIIDPYFEVTASDGSRRTLDATWNEATQLYTAVADYPSQYRLPVSVEFDYIYADTTAYNRQEIFDAEVNTLLSAHNELVEGVQNYMHVGELLVDQEDSMAVKFSIGNTPDDGPSYILSAKLEDYNQVMSMREELDIPFLRSVMDGDTVASFFIVNSPKSTTVYFANLNKHDAYSQTIDSEMPASARPSKISWGGIVSKVADFFSPTPSNLLDINKNINEYGGKIDDAANALEALNYIDQMQAQYDEYNNILSNRINLCQYLLLARCPNGDLRVPSSMYGHFQEAIRREDSNRKIFCKQMQAIILAYCHALENAGYKEIAKELGKFTAGYLTKAGVKRCGGVLNNMAKTGIGTADQFGGMLTDGVSDAMGTIIDATVDAVAKGLKIPTDYAGVRAYFERWTPQEFHKHSMSVTDLRFSITASYEKCKEEEIDRPPVRWAKRMRRIKPIVDPSGFVYEGMATNRIAGVTATIYYKESEEAAEQLWDAAEFGQENPLLTNTAGIYMWNVPQGLWQVRFEKEGFQPTSTEWLPVPPPQLEVNIPMTRTSAPVVKEAMAFSDHVGISFDRPMLTSSLAGISVSQNGQKVEGTTEAIDESEGLALSARFTPASNFTANTVTLTIPTTVKSYAGISLTPEYSTTLEVRHAIEGLIVEDGAAIKVGDVGYVTVTAYPAVAVRGKAISVSTASSLIGIEADELLFTDDGQCLVPLKGLLPGQAVVTFAIGDIVASATVYVKYSLNEACARPVASINSGADVVPGTMVELYTATEGATIYYTTDGSCPCDELSRKRYTEPIVITEPVTIQAMAVSDGLDDSEIVTLRYGIGTYSAIETVTAATKDLDTYYTLRGMPVMPPLAKGVYIHVSRTPQGMKSRKVFIK